MKKLITVILCLGMLTACGRQTTPAPAPSPSPQAPTQTAPATPVRTMISPSGNNPIGKDWTVLGETSMFLGEEYADVILATDAKRGEDGYMMWDDSHKWALVVEGEENSYVLFSSKMSGKAYIDVTARGDETVISLITTSTVGMSMTEYIYSDGAFYAEEVITPKDNGNNIYSSIPDYLE